MPRRYIRRKQRYKRPADEALLRFLMEKGGSATKDEICRRTADGKLFIKAAPLLGDLIVTETTRAKASKRPVKRVSLTLRGMAAAQFLRPDWQPRRLATPILKAWFDELVTEHEPWAFEILRDADDAQEWRAIQAKIKRGELIIGPPKPKARPRGRPFIGQGVHGDMTSTEQRLITSSPVTPTVVRPLDKEQSATPNCIICESDRLLGAKTEHDCNQFRPLALGEPPTAQLKIATQAPSKPSLPCRRYCKYCERCHTNTDVCQCGSNHVCGTLKVDLSLFPNPKWKPEEPKAQQAPPVVSGLADKIRNAGYSVNSKGEVLYSGFWISADEWTQRMPHIKV